METSVEEQPLFLSYKQGQDLTGLSRGTLFGLISTGKVEAAKIGARVLINRASLVEYLESQSYMETARN